MDLDMDVVVGVVDVVVVAVVSAATGLPRVFGWGVSTAPATVAAKDMESTHVACFGSSLRTSPEVVPG